MEEETEQNIIRKIIKSEITWIVFVIGVIWAVVTTIIIPINTIQITQATILVTLSDVKATNANFDNRITDNSNSIIVIQEEIKNLLKSKHE